MVKRQVVSNEKRNQILNEQVEIMRRNSTFQYIEGDIWEMLFATNIQEDIIME